jgi:hypothetical protein
MGIVAPEYLKSPEDFRSLIIGFRFALIELPTPGFSRQRVKLTLCHFRGLTPGNSRIPGILEERSVWVEMAPDGI